jgi:hypothetical protein
MLSQTLTGRRLIYSTGTILRGDGLQTIQGVYSNNKATRVVQDVPSKVTRTPEGMTKPMTRHAGALDKINLPTFRFLSAAFTHKEREPQNLLCGCPKRTRRMMCKTRASALLPLTDPDSDIHGIAVDR